MSGKAAGRVDLTTMLADVLFTSSVMVASGCGGTGRELSRFCDLTEVGAFVTPSVTREGSAGQQRQNGRGFPQEGGDQGRFPDVMSMIPMEYSGSKAQRLSDGNVNNRRGQTPG